jgi:hypothetical protein
MESGSCGKTCRRACWLNLEAHPAHDESEVSLRTCSRGMWNHLLSENCSYGAVWRCIAEFYVRLDTARRLPKFGGEDRNRTYLGPGYAEPTTVLKTARTTRHPSLSRLWIAECGMRKAYFAFLIAETTASKSGQSPVSSLEWSNLPLARISKAPPLEGISVSDLMRSPSSRIWVAKLTAFGV